MKLFFVTGNAQKFSKGSQICAEHNITLVQKELNIDEVQSEDPKYVAHKKAEAAYKELEQPVLITDDSWEIHGLNGFPGNYAKSINTWLNADDLIRLTRDLKNRAATFRQVVVYQDDVQQKLFVKETAGVVLKEARGTAGFPTQQIISLEPDGKKSISEMIIGGHYTGTEASQAWHDFVSWYKKGRS